MIHCRSPSTPSGVICLLSSAVAALAIEPIAAMTLGNMPANGVRSPRRGL
jgi:hypothetical protein